MTTNISNWHRLAAILAAIATSCAAARTPTAEPTPDKFTMYNIIPFSPEREDVAAKDAIEYTARTGNRIVLYSLTLHPQGKPASAKVDAAVASYMKFAKLLEGTDVKPGILLQAILGHWNRVDKEVEPWQRTLMLDGTVKRFCPLDPRFRDYIRTTAAKLAACRPCLILTDDDVRNFSPKAECFCPLHVAEFNRRAGTQFDSQTMRAAANGWKRGDPLDEAFSQLQKDTAKGVCALVREGINSVDPSIPAGACQPGWPREQVRVPEYAQTLAADGQTPFFRLGNGQYTENTPKSDLHSALIFTMQNIDLAKGSGCLLLDEADTFPHNPWAKSAAAMHAKLVTSAFAGLKGAKLWLVNCHKGKYPVSRNYTDILAAHRGLYDAVASASDVSEPCGILIPCHPGYPFDSLKNDSARTMAFDSGSWAHKVFGVFGIPFLTTFDFNQDAIYAIAGATAVKRFSDEELRKLLSRRLLLDGDAANAMVERGFGEYMGLEIAKGTNPRWTGERDEDTGDSMVFPMTSGAPSFRALPGAEVRSWLVWRAWSGAKDFERVEPSAVLSTNTLGGTVMSVAYHMHMGNAYSYSEARLAWLTRRLADLNGGKRIDNVSSCGQNALSMVRKTADGADVVLFANLNYDPLRSVRLSRREKPASVEILSPHGKWGAAEWEWADGNLCVSAALPCYETTLLRIK